ncbi:MAG TPA: DUF3618 domain-containing protein [Gemmatimonadales bacterium]|nr:DUF3618 domain-containing protein [Gemmatimonadales bacterium]
MTDYQRRMTDPGYDADPQVPAEMGTPEPGSRTADIERDIEQTRARMTRDIDEISERLRPSNLARETVETVRHEARRTGNQLADLMRENSLAVAAVGLGATWWFVQRERGGPVSGDRMSRFAYTGPDRWGGEYGERRGGFRRRVGDTVHRARDVVSHAASGVADRATSAKDKAGEAAGRVQERVHDLGVSARARAREQGRRAQTGLERTLSDNPLVLVAGAAVLGVVVGLLLPGTEREDEILGPTRDRLAERAGDTLDRAKDVAVDAAREVKETVRSEVRERAPELKAVVQGAAERIGDQVKDTAGRAAEDAKDAIKRPNPA